MSTTKSIFTVLPLAALVAAEAWANDPVNFVKRSWDDVGKRVVEKDTSITDYFTLNGTASKDDYTLDRDIPYVVKKSFGRYKVVVPKNAVVNLVICDGATLEGGIDIDEGATLNIFAQSDGDNMGKIVAQRLGPSAPFSSTEAISMRRVEIVASLMKAAARASAVCVKKAVAVSPSMQAKSPLLVARMLRA